MEAAIYKINREVLADGVTLPGVIYPNDALNCFWADDWSPGMFRALARAGFLTICHELPTGEPILIAQLHEHYCVLDWPDLIIDRRISRLARRGELAARGVHLHINIDPGPVCEGILRCHGQDSWLSPPYAALMRELAAHEVDGVRAVAVELWDAEQNRLIAGELGYTIGAVYVSLTGFLDRSAPRHNHFGKVQLAALGKLLRGCGFAFWNLGQTYQEYKFALGAHAEARQRFLKRWREASTQRPAILLAQICGRRIAVAELLDCP